MQDAPQGFMIPSQPMTADAAKYLLRMMASMNVPATEAPSVMVANLSLQRIADGIDTVVPSEAASEDQDGATP